MESRLFKFQAVLSTSERDASSEKIVEWKKFLFSFQNNLEDLSRATKSCISGALQFC